MISYFPPVSWSSKSDQDPEKKRIEMLCLRREVRNADLSSGIMESSEGVDGSIGAGGSSSWRCSQRNVREAGDASVIKQIGQIKVNEGCGGVHQVKRMFGRVTNSRTEGLKSWRWTWASSLAAIGVE